MSPNLEDLIRQSKFVFTGTVQKLNAASMPGVPVSESTVIVKVDDILLAPAALTGFKGKDITVRLIKPGSAKRGEQSVFYTNGWIYGKSLAVVEVGRTEAAKTDELRKQIAATVEKNKDRDLQARLAAAQLIVAGKVTATKALKREGPPVSEHDPEWWEATVALEAVVKGDAKLKTVTVLYPSSKDEMWINSPKFHPGQEGVWILQKDQKEKAPRWRVAGYTALDPLDFQPKQQLEHIRTLNQLRK